MSALLDLSALLDRSPLVAGFEAVPEDSAVEAAPTAPVLTDDGADPREQPVAVTRSPAPAARTTHLRQSRNTIEPMVEQYRERERERVNRSFGPLFAPSTTCDHSRSALSDVQSSPERNSGVATVAAVSAEAEVGGWGVGVERGNAGESAHLGGDAGSEADDGAR